MEEKDRKRIAQIKAWKRRTALKMIEKQKKYPTGKRTAGVKIVKKRSDFQKLVLTADDLYRTFVRLRDADRLWCSNPKCRGEGRTLEVAHGVKRGNLAVRHLNENGVLLCDNCNHLDIPMQDIIDVRFGPGTFLRLKKEAHDRTGETGRDELLETIRKLKNDIKGRS